MSKNKARNNNSKKNTLKKVCLECGIQINSRNYCGACQKRRQRRKYIENNKVSSNSSVIPKTIKKKNPHKIVNPKAKNSQSPPHMNDNLDNSGNNNINFKNLDILNNPKVLMRTIEYIYNNDNIMKNIINNIERINDEFSTKNYEEHNLQKNKNIKNGEDDNQNSNAVFDISSELSDLSLSSDDEKQEKNHSDLSLSTSSDNDDMEIDEKDEILDISDSNSKEIDPSIQIRNKMKKNNNIMIISFFFFF